MLNVAYITDGEALDDDGRSDCRCDKDVGVSIFPSRWRSEFRETHCVDGRLYQADPQPWDPANEYDVGLCPECNGKGCVPKQEDADAEI